MKYNQKYKFNMRGWFNDSWRHMMAAKGIKTGNKSLERILYSAPKKKDISTLEKKVGIREFEKGVLPAKLEVKPVVKIGTGKKAPLLIQESYLIDTISQLKDDSQASQELIQEHEDDLISVQEKLKRITGRPATEPVKGADIHLGLVRRYEGTSGKRPDIVREAIGDKESFLALEVKPLRDLVRSKRQRIISREMQAEQRAIPRIVEVAEMEAEYGKPIPLKLKHLVRQRGRPKGWKKDES